ncbi:MAG TPA: hypothetical protein VJK50_00940 [Patescibacteria group bacterium]|nr:hypothetical protein [Patescibacteria group bacterium]
MSREAREAFYQLNRERLQELAHKALTARRLKPDEFLIVCIEADDPEWKDLVDLLMPNHNWQQYRDRGEKPIARGSVVPGVREYLREVVPDIADALYEELPEGVVRAVIMASGGASVYHIQPVSELQHNFRNN